MSVVPVVIKMTIGCLYVIGASLLLPGFVWIQALEPLCLSVIDPGPPNPFPVDCSNPNITRTIKTIPHYKDGKHGAPDDYGKGAWFIVVGTSLFLCASFIDFVWASTNPHHMRDQEHRDKPDDMMPGSFAEAGQSLAEAAAAGSGAGSCLKRMLGPTLMTIGSALLVTGSVMFLKRFSMGGENGKPLDIFGEPFPDVASLMFQIASVVFLISAFTAIGGTSAGIMASRKSGRPTCVLWFSLIAFACFIPCSGLYFSSSYVEDDVQAGHVRMVGTAFLASACYILFAVGLYEVLQGPSMETTGSTQMAKDEPLVPSTMG